MNSTNNIVKRFLSCASVMLALLMLTPTFISLLTIANPESTISLVMENPLEEEREEERSSGEEDLKELKEFTMPSELASKDTYSTPYLVRYQYTIKQYSSELSVPYMPPEFIG